VALEVDLAGIDPYSIALLEQIAARQGLSLSEIIGQIIEEGVRDAMRERYPIRFAIWEARARAARAIRRRWRAIIRGIR